MSELWDKLAAEFPRNAVSWRAQSVTKDGSKAMALAYLDARDIRRRLNEVLGPANWMNEFKDCGDGKLSCRLSVRVDGEWVHKEDGAGETQVEAEKGAFSSALKRAAVAFGIGEYLYDMPTPWVPCESAEWNGKKQWKSWKDDPWNHVRRPQQQRQDPPITKTYNHYLTDITNAANPTALKSVFGEAWKALTGKDRDDIKIAYEARKEQLEPTDGYVPPIFDKMENGQ